MLGRRKSRAKSNARRRDSGKLSSRAMPKKQDERESDTATRLLRGRTVEKVWRHREGEVGLLFADGARLFVNARAPIDVSITGPDPQHSNAITTNSPSAAQIEFARSLGIDPTGHSARVMAALIQDRLEQKATVIARQRGISAGVRVRYNGPRADMPKTLVVSTISRNGFVFFRRSHKYCRPWFLERE